MRDYIHSSFNGAHSQTSFHTTVMRTGKQDVSEVDVSSKKMKILNKPHRYLTMAGQDRPKYEVGIGHYSCHNIGNKIDG